MNAKALIPLVAGLGIGGLALKLGLDTLKSARGAQKPAENTQVWGPKQDIPRGTAITEEMLQSLPFPPDLVPEGAFSEKEALVGRVPRVVMPGGLPVLETMLAPEGTKAGIYVKPGYRAVAVKIDASSGVDYHLEPGCFVDVVGSFKIRRGKRQETIARTIIENVEVAAVGERLSPATSSEEEPKGRNRMVRAVVLFVEPDQQKQLLLAEQRGQIKLGLRGNADSQILDDQVVASDLELTGEAAEAAAAEPAATASGPSFFDLLGTMFAKQAEQPPVAVAMAPPKPWTMTVYHGPEAEKVQFKHRDSDERITEGTEGGSGQGVSDVPGGRISPASTGSGPYPVLDADDGAGQDQGASSEPEEPTE